MTVAAIVEEFAKADAGFATTIIASNLALKAVLFGGNEEQKQHACDLMLAGKHGAFCLTEPQAGSDASNSKATEFGGQVSGEHGIGHGKVPFLAESVGAVNMRLMEDIKKAFDPNLILNPGKVCYKL